MDTNIIISGLVKRSTTLFRIIDFYRQNVELLIPEYAKEEIYEKINKIEKYSKLSRNELDYILSILFRLIKIIPKDVFIESLRQAYEIAKNFDKDDAPFIALALKLNTPYLD